MLHYETFNRTIVKLNQIENSPKNQVIFLQIYIHSLIKQNEISRKY